MKITDRFIQRFAYFYIGLPFIIFLFGWLKIAFSIPLSLLFLTSIYFSLVQYQPDNEIVNQIKLRPKQFYLLLFFIFIFLFFSGIGSYSFQNEDHQYRNAILQDLVNFDWPVIYQVKGFATENPLEGHQSILVYYLGYWLPAAIIGKLFGTEAANLAIFLWSIIGLVLVIYYLCKYFKTFSMQMFWLFIAWGSLYFIGTFFTFPYKEIFKGNAYLWAGNLLYADGNTGLIYWTFNQTITPWLIILLIMNQLNPKNLLFLSSLIFFFGPFAFIGFVPFIGYFIYKKEFGNNSSPFSFKNFLLKYFSFANTIGASTVLIISYLYFSGNSSGNVFNFVVPTISTYFIFVFLSIGIISILLFNRYNRNPLYYLILVILLILPFFQLGFGLDLSARASIPAMFLLMLFVIEYIIFEKRSIRKKAVVFYMIIAGIGHNMQFGRSVYFTGIQAISYTKAGETLAGSSNSFIKNLGDRILIVKGKNITTRNELGTLNNPQNNLVRNFMGLTSNSVFYNYLAKTDGK